MKFWKKEKFIHFLNENFFCLRKNSSQTTIVKSQSNFYTEISQFQRTMYIGLSKYIYIDLYNIVFQNSDYFVSKMNELVFLPKFHLLVMNIFSYFLSSQFLSFFTRRMANFDGRQYFMKI